MEYEYSCPECNTIVSADTEICPKCGKLLVSRRDMLSLIVAIATIVGIGLLIAGFVTSPSLDSSDTSFELRKYRMFADVSIVNAYKIHIKQTLYYFSGICFVVAAVLYGVKKLMEALSALHTTLRKTEDKLNS